LIHRIAIFFSACLMASALSLVNAQFQARRLFIELEKAQASTRQLELEWTQLKLDQSTYGKHARIEAAATQELNMVTVTPARTQYLTAARAQ